MPQSQQGCAMTVESGSSRAQYSTNGTSGPWTVPFYFLENSHLRVYYTNADGVETQLVLSAGYNVSGAGNPSGGSVTTTEAYVAGGAITILRDVPATQLTDYRTADSFPAETHEVALDKLTMIVQQQGEVLDRAIVFAPSDQSSAVLPSAEDRANRFLGFNGNGDAVVFDIPVSGVVSDAGSVAWSQTGEGALGRNVRTKLRETISVSDFASPADAVAAALAQSADLFWPIFVETTISIPDFHSVRHFGPGGVIRGGDVFYITPGAGDTNHVYVNSASGNDANDGLSASQPKLTLQGGIDYFQNWAHALTNGTWKLKLAAGTYARGAFPNNGNTAGLLSRNPLYVEGPDVGGHPNVPTALIKEGATQAATGLNCSFNNVYVKNVKVEDFNGSVSSQGILGGQGSNLFLENVHLEDCYYGVTAGSRGLFDAKGGIWNDCGFLNSTTLVGSGGAGARMLFFIQSAIGNQGASDRSQGPFITNCVNGILAQEHVTGHVDWCLFNDNGNAIYCLLNSRLNTNSSEFNRNSVVARADNGSNVDLSDTLNAYGSGADANDRRVHMGVGCLGAHTAVLDGINYGTGSNEVRFLASYPDTAISSTSSGSTIETQTINGGWLTGPAVSGRAAPKIRVVVSGSFAGTNGAKNLAIRLGSGGPTAQVNFAAAVTGVFHVEMSVDFEVTAKQLLRAVGWCDDNSVQVGITEATIDMEVDQPIIAHAWVGNAADSITIRSIEWFIVGV